MLNDIHTGAEKKSVPILKVGKAYNKIYELKVIELMKHSSLLLALMAIVIWSFQGYLTMDLSQQSPFLYGGIALSIGGLISIKHVSQWRVPPKTLLVGVGGIL